MMVVAADAIYEVLINGPSASSVGRQLAPAMQGVGALLAPANLYTDVLGLLLANFESGAIESRRDLELRMDKLGELPLHVIRGSRFIKSCLDLDPRQLLPGDRFYLSAAQSEDLPLMTTREDLARAARARSIPCVQVF